MKYKKQARFALIVLIVLAVAAVVDYHLARQRIEESIKAGIQYEVRQGNEPFIISSENDTAGVLLMHGFTASPWEVKELGEHLSEYGMTVYGPLIPGHGTTPEDLRKTRWQDWYEAANMSFNMLKQDFDCVYVGGMSTGSLLALKLALEYDVCGIISIGTPIYFQDWKAKFAWIGKYVIPYTKVKLSDDLKQFYYDKRPTAAVAELYELVGTIKNRLHEIKEPIILLHSLEDRTIKPESSQYISDNIGSERKTLVWVEHGEHVILKDSQRKEVFASIIDFMQKENGYNSKH
jgi:carboxylesterase